MDIPREHRFGFILATVGFIAAFIFFIHLNLKGPIAKVEPGTLLAAVDQTDTALLGWWKFDEGSGSTAADSATASGHFGSGTVSGTLAWTTGVANGAFSFDGVSNRVDIPYSSAENVSAITVSAWVRLTGTPDDYDSIVSRGVNTQTNASPFYLDVRGGYLAFGSSDGTNYVTLFTHAPVSQNTWYHAVGTYDGTTYKFYLNGTLVDSAIRSLPLGTSNQGINIGYRSPNSQTPGNFLKGDVDDVRIYSRALDSGEVATLYSYGGGTPGDSQAPTTPTNLSASAVSSSQINLSWTASTDNTAVTGYKIYRNSSQVGTSATNSYSDTGLSASTAYTYTVAAYDAANNTSSQSSSASATTQASSGGGGGGGGGTTPVGGPGAGAHTIYVDQTLSADCAGTYSIVSRNCSGSDGYAYNTAQKASDASSPGNTVMFRAGTYQDIAGGDIYIHVLNITNSGTAQQPITYQPYGSEHVIFRGLGFEDRDLNNDGWADGPLQPNYREELIFVNGDYIRVTGFEITNSEGGGLEVDGSHVTIDNLDAHDQWGDNLDIGFSNLNLVQDILVNNVKSYRSHHGAGLGYGRYRGPINGVLKDVTIKDSLFYENGFYVTNGVLTRASPANGDSQGGGNSWGVFADRSCGEDVVAGYEAACVNIIYQGNVSWTNVDSSYVPDSDTLMLNNIAFNDGWEGDGIKDYDTDTRNLYMIGNIIYANINRGVELRVTQGGSFINNTIVGNGGPGVWGGVNGPLYNNISYANNTANLTDPVTANGICLNGEDCTNNLEGADPHFYSLTPLSATPFKDGSGNPIVINVPAGMTVAQEVVWFQDKFRNAFSIQPGSPAIDTGRIASYTDPITGQVHTVPYYGSAPDMGAYEYQVGQVINPPPPPTVDTTAPTISQLAATSVTSTSATITWTTNEGATTEVDYSTDTSYGTHTTPVNTLVTSHSQALTGLTPSTLYYYKVISIDGSGNPANSTGSFTTTASGAAPVNQPAAPSSGSGGGGGGGGGGGAPALIISNIKASGSVASGVTVTWNTSNPASSQINYGVTTVYGSQTSFDSTLVTSHSQKITALVPNTLYHMQVRSKDAYGTLQTSADVTFTTSSVGAVSTVVQNNPAAPISNMRISVPAITSWLVLGTTDTNVKSLQQLLNASGFTVAVSGTGSKGNETNYFGPATMAALERFQCAKLSVCSGSSDTTGYGATGPKTRAALNALIGNSTAVTIPTQLIPATVPTVTPTGSVTTWLVLGATNAQVKLLQQILNAKGFTVSASGVGSKGNESMYFGPATAAALKRFQCATLQVCSGSSDTTGYGATGPRTRAALNSK